MSLLWILICHVAELEAIVFNFYIFYVDEYSVLIWIVQSASAHLRFLDFVRKNDIISQLTYDDVLNLLNFLSSVCLSLS